VRAHDVEKLDGVLQMLLQAFKEAGRHISLGERVIGVQPPDRSNVWPISTFTTCLEIRIVGHAARSLSKASKNTTAGLPRD